MQSLSYSCGTYITKPAVPLCVQHRTYTQNNNQYTIQIQSMYINHFINVYVNVNHFPDRSHACRDGHAVITDSDWVILCPPSEDVTSQATVPILGEPHGLLPSEEIGTHKNLLIIYVCTQH